jgi:hypothetical protein
LLIQEAEFANDRRPLGHFLERLLPGANDDLGCHHVLYKSAGSQTKSAGYVWDSGLCDILIASEDSRNRFSSRLIPFVSKGSRTMRLEIELGPGGSAKLDASSTLQKAGSITASCDEVCDGVIFAQQI